MHTSHRFTGRILTVAVVALVSGTNVAHTQTVPAKEAFLVKDGRAHCEIVIAGQSPRSVRLAADELQHYLRQISGAEIPISTAPSPHIDQRIYIGRSTYTDDLGISDEDLQHGAYRMVSGTDWLVLIGHDTDFVPKEPWARNHTQRGTELQPAWEQASGVPFGVPDGGLYKNRDRMPEHLARQPSEPLWAFDERGSYNAVCGYLRNLGVRWYMPGELGEVVPKRATIPLEPIDVTERPDFAVRQFNIRFGTADDQVMRWAMRLGIRQCYGLMIAHGMHTMTAPDSIKRDHPDWFALYGGKRDTEGGKRLNHLCYSNPELFDATVQWARAVFDVYDFESVSVMPPDAYIAICQCPLCEGKDQPDRGSRGKLSNHVWDFVNRVAKEVGKTHPDKKIVCCAYGANTEPPTNIDRLEPNVEVVIVGGRRPRNNLPDQRDAIDRLRRDWLDKTTHPILIFENYPFTDRGFYLPAFVATTIGESINATKGISRGEDIWLSFPRYHDADSMGFDHFQIYFTARMWWGGSDADVAALLEEYCHRFYGPAGPALLEFFRYCEANYQAMETDAEKVDTALALFERARSSVDGDSVHAKRIALIDQFLDALRSKAKLLAQKRGPVPKLRTVWDPKEPIVIDGKLNDQYWRDCPTAAKGRLRELQTGTSPAFGTSFQAGWDRDNVYFAIRCDDAVDEPLNIATTDDDDPSLWYGDAIEIELATDSHSYYQIAVNPAGAIIDLDRGVDKAAWFRWESKAEVATHIAEDHWTVEIRIPVTEDDNDPLHQVVGRKPSQSLPWHFNLCRQRIRPNDSEFSAFSPTGTASFHVPSKFAHFYDGRSHTFDVDLSVTDFIIEATEASKQSRQRHDEQALARFVELADQENITPQQRSYALSQAAACARHMKEFAKASELANSIPDTHLAMIVQCENLLAQRKWDDALAVWDQENLNAWPFTQIATAAFARGRARFHTGDRTQATDDFQLALRFTTDKQLRTQLEKLIAADE